jgi:hypothetical protein
MIVSNCCKDSVHVLSGNEGLSYYVCDLCLIECDVRLSLNLGGSEHDVSGHEVTA